MNSGVDWDAEHRRVLLGGNAALERSAQSVVRSQAIAAESEQIGTEVVSELGEQRERLLRAKRRLSQTDEELNKTRKILYIMRWRVLTNKIVLIFIILLELGILGIIIKRTYKMIIVHDEEYYRRRVPEPDLGPLRNFLRFIYNDEIKTFLGRTGREWIQLGFFYLCFFSVLGLLFALQMWISISYVSKLDQPFFLYSGLASRSYFDNFPIFRHLDFGSPGIGFKPNILLPTESPIIWMSNSSAIAKPERYVQALTDFLQEYNKTRENYKTDGECRDGMPITYTDLRPCFFDIKSLGICGKPPYGYTNPLQPCILIKFNKRFDWVPVYYNRSSQLPENMPHALREVVRSSNELQTWLWCDGVNGVDKEHIGEIDYLPSQGFPVRYFPFVGQPDYLSPIVALQFKNITPGRLVTVECSLWALNINKNTQKPLDFQIILDET